MRVLVFSLACLFVMNCETSFSQCITRDSLWKKVRFIHYGSRGMIDKLNEFLKCKEEVENCPGNTDSVYTLLLGDIGVQYYKRKDFVAAIEYTWQALDIVKANISRTATDKMQLPKFYYYLSVYYDSLHLVAQKNDAIDSCISVETQLNTNYIYSGMVLETNVPDLFLKGDYNRCVERAGLGEAFIHRFYKYPDSLSHIAWFVYYKASSLGFLGRYTEEEQFLKSKAAQLEKVRDNEFRGSVYTLWGQVYKSKGEYEKAVQSFQKAFYYDRLSSKKEFSAQILDHIGMIYSENLGQYKLALQYYKRALGHSLYRKVGNASVSDSFYVLGNIASVYVKMKLFDPAFYFFQAAFDKIKPGIDEKDLALHVQEYVNENNVEDVLRIVLDKANGYLQRFSFNKDRKDLQSSLQVYKTADQLLNAIKVQLGDLESKLFWRRYATRLYENAIEASYLEGNLNNVFYFFEKSRAVILTDQLNEQAGISESDALKLAALRKKILMLKRKRDDIDITSNAFTNVQNDLLVSEIELNKLETEIKKHNPLYDQKLIDSSFISVETMRQDLSKNGQTLVEFYNGDSATYLFIISAEKTFIRKIDKSLLDSLSAAYIDYVSQAEVLNRSFNSFLNVSNQLYRLLFGDVSLPGGRIIISPGGKFFPFEALVTNRQPLTYFVDDYPVSYTYSARYLLHGFGTNPAFSPHTFMGFAPLTYSNGMPALSQSDQSLQRMRKYFRSAKNLLGGEASLNNFLRDYYNYTIVQLYTHATDSGSTGEPQIYFADATLSMSDLLYEYRPATRLIVLSACETAKGKLYNGEGVFSFNRQFAALGIPSCVSTLWKVSNQATYRLTELFYKYLAKGLPLDVALEKAKKEFRETAKVAEEKLPYYWAAPILVGKTDPIPLPARRNWGLIAGAAFLASILLSGWLIRKRK